MASSQWSELEDYRQLLREYEQRTADYERRLRFFRHAQAAEDANPAELERAKQELDNEQPALETLYRRLEVMRKELARARDAAPAH